MWWIWIVNRMNSEVIMLLCHVYHESVYSWLWVMNLSRSAIMDSNCSNLGIKAFKVTAYLSCVWMWYKLKCTFRNTFSCLHSGRTSSPTCPPEGVLCLLKAPVCHFSLSSLSDPGVSPSAQNYPGRNLVTSASPWLQVWHDNCTHSGDKRTRNNKPTALPHLCAHECVKEVWGASVYRNAKVSAFSGYPSAAISLASHHGSFKHTKQNSQNSHFLILVALLSYLVFHVDSSTWHTNLNPLFPTESEVFKKQTLTPPGFKGDVLS